jgi:hypothetical protein
LEAEFEPKVDESVKTDENAQNENTFTSSEFEEIRKEESSHTSPCSEFSNSDSSSSFDECCSTSSASTTDSRGRTCFSCGETCHISRKCPKKVPLNHKKKLKEKFVKSEPVSVFHSNQNVTGSRFQKLKKFFYEKSANLLKYLSKGKQKFGDSSYDSPVREPKKVFVSDTLPSDCPKFKRTKTKGF